MRLPDYIDKIGTKEFAEKFGVTERAAISYRQGTRRPRPEIAQRIVDNSPVTWEGIYSPEPSQRSALRAQA
jgi:hypothetical protein